VTAIVDGGDLVCRAGVWTVRVPAPDGVNLTNVACALGVARELGVDDRVLETALHGLHGAEHRGELQSSSSGVTVIDDTFSSNPAGARAAIQRLGATAAAGRRVVITPGMVELGAEQRAANFEFARLAGDVADLVIIVGTTNRGALREGVRGAQRARTVEVRTRDDAVAWVREHGRPGDVVLYENDLPDHYA
jgi:UDP-N-acetylmuramoyl-tripeptide--D-alanyl-D-alanine ligase